MTSFVGAARPLTRRGIDAVCQLIGVGPAEVWTVLSVETRGCGFFPSAKPSILFERHIFSSRTGGKFDATHPGISNASAGGYGLSGETQYQRLGEALVLNRVAALESASWGIGQVMGFNHAAAGCSSAEQLVNEAMQGEDEQLMHFARFICQDPAMWAALVGHQWATFARRYNGPGYARNKYDVRLAQQFAKWSVGLLPDLSVRAAQIRLVRAGYDPGPIDGVEGDRTRAALAEYPAAMAA